MDADYYRRNVEAEFVIEAVMSPSFPHISQQFKMNWPWNWDNTNAVLPAEAGDD
jgi:putative ATP-dependent endonuclease of OLD family